MIILYRYVGLNVKVCQKVISESREEVISRRMRPIARTAGRGGFCCRWWTPFHTITHAHTHVRVSTHLNHVLHTCAHNSSIRSHTHTRTCLRSQVCNIQKWWIHKYIKLHRKLNYHVIKYSTKAWNISTICSKVQVKLSIGKLYVSPLHFNVVACSKLEAHQRTVHFTKWLFLLYFVCVSKASQIL